MKTIGLILLILIVQSTSLSAREISGPATREARAVRFMQLMLTIVGAGDREMRVAYEGPRPKLQARKGKLLAKRYWPTSRTAVPQIREARAPKRDKSKAPVLSSPEKNQSAPAFETHLAETPVAAHRLTRKSTRVKPAIHPFQRRPSSRPEPSQHLAAVRSTR